MLMQLNREQSRGNTRWLLMAVLALCAAVGTLRAQVTASVTGTVKDASGAVVPDAAISARNVESGLTRSISTDANGGYVLPSLPVGQYELTVEKSGFKQQVRKGLTLTVAQQAVINFSLELGDVAQQVTVTAEVPIVNTTLSPTSGLVSEQQVKDLPLNGRSYDQLLTLNVGTTNYSSNLANGNTSRSVFSVAGKRPETNRFLINGVDFVGSDSSGQVVTPNGSSGQLLGVDAVREFNVVQHTYGAEYGKRAGGQISIVTTSGTNQLHGSVFEFLRNSVLDARNFFDRYSGQRVPPFKRNQFGGSLGGPLKTDKVFLFGNYEGFRQRLGISNVSVVPDDDARRGLLPTGPGGALVAPALLKTGMLPYFAYWPVANGPKVLVNGLPSGTALSFDSPVQKIREDFGLMRFDYTLSSKDSLSSNYTIDDGENLNPQGNPLFVADTPQRSQTLSLQETRVFSPTLLNIATIGFGRAKTTSGVSPAGAFPANLSLISNTVPGSVSIGGGIVATVASALTAANGVRATTNVRNLFTYADDVKWVRGSHTISLGGWMQRVQQNLGGSPTATAGSITYPTLLAFLQDQPTQFIAVPNPTPLGYRTTQGAWYMQDEFKLRSNLTLRVGLRHELTNGWNEVTNRNANYIFDSNGIIQTAPRVGGSAFLENNSRFLMQPRVGLAWDPTGTGSWAVRAGFGVHNDLQDNLAHRLSSNPPFNARLSLTTPLLSFAPLPGGTQPPPSCTAVGQTGCSTFQPGGIDPTLHSPTIQQWSFTVEHELAKDLSLQLGYVGAQSYHLSVSINMNSAQPVVCNDGAGCPSGGTRGAVARVPAGTTYYAPGPRPNPLVANTFSWFYEGTSSYHALNATLLKRTTRGLAFKTNYTLSKVMDLNSAVTSSSGTNEPQMIYNPYNLELSKGVAAFSLLHQFNTSFTYELPFGEGQRWASNASGLKGQLIGGWQINGILTAQGGFPFTPQTGANTSGNGDSFNPDVPNHNTAFSGPVLLKTPDHWYDPNAFSLPIAGTFGNVSRGQYIGPRLNTLDLSAFKKITINDRMSMQFRAETFNVLNHANFGSPSPIVFSGTTFSPTAGVITKTATTSRQIQFALKLMF